jgi:hypothetical protein
MTRSTFDPALTLHRTSDAEELQRLESLRARLRLAASLVAERVFLREIALVIAEPIARILPANLQAEKHLQRALAPVLTTDEREAVAQHAEDIADTLARAWVDLWARTLANGASRITHTAPTEPTLSATWSETLSQLGLTSTEADEIFSGFYRALHDEGAVFALPQGLVIDGRTSDLWLKRAQGEGALEGQVEEYAVSGQQLRSADVVANVPDAQKRKPG